MKTDLPKAPENRWLLSHSSPNLLLVAAGPLGLALKVVQTKLCRVWCVYIYIYIHLDSWASVALHLLVLLRRFFLFHLGLLVSLVCVCVCVLLFSDMHLQV